MSIIKFYFLELEFISSLKPKWEKKVMLGGGSLSWYTAPTQLDFWAPSLPLPAALSAFFAPDWELLCGAKSSYDLTTTTSCQRKPNWRGWWANGGRAAHSKPGLGSAVSLNQLQFSSLSLMEISPLKRRIIGCVWMSHIWHDSDHSEKCQSGLTNRIWDNVG